MAASKRFFPAFLDLEGRHVVVIGSGPAVERKARQFTRYGAEVTVISPDPSLDLQAAEAYGLVTVEPRAFESGDLEGVDIVVCLDDDPQLMWPVREEARHRRILASFAGDPESSGFLFPGVVNREPLQVAVSTSGMAPEVAKEVRRSIAETYGPHWSALVVLLSSAKALVLEGGGTDKDASEMAHAALAGGLADSLAEGETLTAADVVERFGPDLASAEEDPA